MERKSIAFAYSGIADMIQKNEKYKVEVKRNGRFSAFITVAKRNISFDTEKGLPPFYGVRISDHVITFFPWRLNIVILKKITKMIQEFEKDEEDMEIFYI